MPFTVYWCDGRHQFAVQRETKAAAEAFIDETGMDPDEFDIVEEEFPDP